MPPVFKKTSDIDLAWLKQHHERIYFFGLGFIQVKIDDTYRLHFYIPELPSFVDHPHNHRYDFTSTILKGSFTNNIFTEVSGSDFLIQEDSCAEGYTPSKLPRSANFKLAASATYHTGQSYFMNHETFHTVSAVDCITLLKRSDYKKELAEVSTPSHQSKICPFSCKMDESELWSYVEKALKPTT